MEIDVLLSFLRGWAFVLITFGLALGFAMFKGRQNLINLLAGLYLGLLLYLVFPFQDQVTDSLGDGEAEAGALIAIFVIFSGLGTWLFARLMPREYFESAFETIGKKLLLSAAATVLVLTLSYHYLPVSDLIDLGSPLPSVLLADNLAFLWLLLPLGVLFVI